jgi:hypothetical protein
MSACLDPTPPERVRLLILAERPTVPEPLEVIGLLDSDLDTNESAAVYAAHLISLINLRFLNWLDTVEAAATHLEQSATASTRAGTAHGYVRNAAHLADMIVADLSDARDALDFNWPGRQALRDLYDQRRPPPPRRRSART